MSNNTITDPLSAFASFTTTSPFQTKINSSQLTITSEQPTAVIDCHVFCACNATVAFHHDFPSLLCALDTSAIVVHTAFTIFVILTLAIRRRINTKKQSGSVRFRGHTFRWLLTLALCLLYVCELCEGVLVAVRVNGFNAQLWIAPCFCFAGTIFSISYYHHAETWNRARMLLALPFYWLVLLAMLLSKMACFYSMDLTTRHVRVWLVGVAIFFYAMLVVVECRVLQVQRYAFSKYPRRIEANSEQFETIYQHWFANFFSKCLFWWMNPLLIQGYKSPIQSDDLGSLPKALRTEDNFAHFMDIYKNEVHIAALKGNKVCLWRCYARAYWQTMTIAAIFKLLGDAMAFASPLAISAIVEYADHHGQEETEIGYFLTVEEYFKNGFVLAVIVFTSNLIKSTLYCHFLYLIFVESIRLKSAIQAMVYEKSLKVSQWSTNSVGASITNLMSTDATNIMMMFLMFHFGWTNTIQIIIAAIFLYLQLGYAALIGVTFIVLLAPLQYKVAAVLSKIHKNTLEFSDERLKRTNELLQGMKLLKLYAWEGFFCRGIEEARSKELRCLLKAAICRGFTSFITQAAPIMVTLVTFGLYTVFEKGHPLTAAKAFSSLALFNLLNIPLFLFPMIVSVLVAAKVSNTRVEEFLDAPQVEATSDDNDTNKEYYMEDTGSVLMKFSTEGDGQSVASNVQLADDDDVFNRSISKTDKPLICEINKATFAWDLDSHQPILKGVNLSLVQSSLTMIVGPVGSGKSSLLSALLGEMDVIRGGIKWQKTRAKIAYSAQKPWLLNASFRENILFGRSFEPKRYNGVIDACALQPDIDILPGGDQTEIGEKGINLSGGQKQRISVARAMYSKSSIVMLDDPLSALDAEVGARVFEKGIMQMLVPEQKTIVLVTHSMQLLVHATHVVVMDDGRIKHQGTYAELKEKNVEFVKKSALKAMLSTEKPEVETCAVERRRLFRLLSTQSQCGGFDHSGGVTQPVNPGQVQERHRTLSRRQAPKLFRQLSRDQSCFLPLPIDECVDEEDDVRAQEQTTDRGSSIRRRRTSTRTSARSSVRSGRHGSSRIGRYSSSSDGKPATTPTSNSSPGGDDVFENSLHMREIAEEELETLEEGRGQDDEEDKEDTSSGLLIKAEERATGKVSWRLYQRYIIACSVTAILLLTVLNLGRQGALIATNIWLSEWSMANTSAKSELDYYVLGYAGLSVAGIVLALLCSLCTEITCLRAAKTLHDAMLQNIALLPARFFDTTPVGRILNRFTSDTNQIDQKLPVTLGQTSLTVLACVAASIINIIVTPFFIAVAIPICIIYYFLQHFYRASSRELQRLDSISKSPIYSHFSETLGGLSTIRAYRVQSEFRSGLLEKIDQNVTAYTFLMTGNRWLGLRLDAVGGIIVFLATLSSVMAAVMGQAGAGFVGLALAYATAVSGSISWLVRDLTDLEMQMNAVDRVTHYAQLPTEKYKDDTYVRPAATWPRHGSISFQHISLRYDASLEPVINNLTLKIGAGEKVGICGRTGSGKSSLTLGLFRLLDQFQGTISIDGLDISRIPLLELRHRLAIIPQDPFMFSGSVRFNLDPSGEADKQEVWEAVEKARLTDLVENLPGKLSASVSEGGENFSAGQRQLFCLARALLRKSTLLVMDEATASLDLETDRLVQRVVSQAFKKCTILTIAHRLSTILNYDRVVVLDRGQIIEQGSPIDLRRKSGGHFYSLLQQQQGH